MNEETQSLNFNSIMLRLASPEKIKEWSHGEVTRAETINYRTQRSERGGLFDERIFGPEKDYECYCGKYRRIRYKDIVCEKCGVEVTRSIVRRDRMGHIELAAPVAHIWFLRGIPSRIGLLLDLSIADLEKVIYFAGYIITSVNEAEKDRVLKELDKEFKSKMKTVNSDEAKEKIKESLLEVKKEINSIRQGLVLDEPTHIKYTYKYATIFESDIGAGAVYNMFQKMDMNDLILKIQEKIEKTSSADKVKLHKRLNLATHMQKAGIRPEWMFLTVIPIIPPALRPMVALDGGRHATSDVNDLYRRVINRNNRLKKLLEINAPEVILRNEKRILQEAVDALIDNSIRHGNSAAGAMSSAQRRPLKSLADILKGKQGRFRQNLLGKRVDYSGRSVIVVGPELHLDQCGLPKHMALELFRPFVISKILEKELAYNIRGAGRLIEDAVPEVWAILEDVIKNKYVLLNRAPTLHRLGIQAFLPILIEGNAIRLHPLVCAAFNADFDGDQMAVHVPLSDEAQAEARDLMCSAKNLLRPGTGDPIVTPKLDIVLGCYWMTKSIDGEKGEGKMFPSPNAAISAYDYDQVGFRAKIKIMGGESEKYRAFDGTIFETSVGKILFNSVLPSDFRYINHEITGKEMPALIEELIEIYGTDAVPAILDKIKAFGFKYMTMSGITWGLNDVRVPAEKPAIIKKAKAAVMEIIKHFDEGLISEDERYKMVISTWRAAWEEIQKLVLGTLDINGGVRDMVMSKARGSIAALSQMCGMKGLIINTSGKTLEFPVIPSYKEGLSPIEYFLTTHGSRKGLTDTALNTSKAGYLTRRLVDVSQDVVVSIEDCGDKEGRTLYAKNILETTLGNAVRSRVLAKDLIGKDGKVVFKKNHLITKKDAKIVEDSEATEATVFSPLTCKSIQGICQKCYGIDLGRNHLVDLGEAVGIVAAQAIGEPGTQLTMRTFHSGGVSEASGDITMGLPRIEEIFEKRAPKNAAVVATVDGTVTDIKNDGKEKMIIITGQGGKKADEGSVEHAVPFTRTIIVRVGNEVKKGDILTDGSANINELFSFGGKAVAEDYILNEVSKIYSMQAAAISRKHIEVILRQMFSRKRITVSGDTDFVEGEVVENQELLRANESNTGAKAKADDMVLGISEVSLTTSSWLSAASFQNTSRILIDAATQGNSDELRGLKENVIIGRLIPAGTGFKKKENYEEAKWETKDENK